MESEKKIQTQVVQRSMYMCISKKREVFFTADTMEDAKVLLAKLLFKIHNGQTKLNTEGTAEIKMLLEISLKKYEEEFIKMKETFKQTGGGSVLKNLSNLFSTKKAREEKSQEMEVMLSSLGITEKNLANGINNLKIDMIDFKQKLPFIVDLLSDYLIINYNSGSVLI